MVQTTLVVYGFFQLCNGIRVHSPRRNDASALTWHCEYETALQCANESGMPAKFRIFSPPGDGALGNRTVSFVQAKAYFPSNNEDPVLLEGIRQAMVPGDPDDDNYQAHAPNLIYSMIHGVGIVQRSTQDGGKADDREFDVEVRPWVRDDNRPCTITCVLPGRTGRWKNVPLPFVNSVVYFSGVCARVRDNGTLEVELDDLVLNFGMASTSSSSSAARGGGQPPSKRQNFDAFAYHPVRRSTGALGDGSFPQDNLSSSSADQPQASSSQDSTGSSVTARSPSPARLGEHAQAHAYSTRAAEKRKMA